MNSREERSRQYFDNPWDVPSSASNQSNAAFLGLDEDRWEVDSSLDNIDQQFSNAASGKPLFAAVKIIICKQILSYENFFFQIILGKLTQTQLVLMEEENTKMIAEREREVSHIVQSISELNTIFKDLAHMVADQVGTFLNQKITNGALIHLNYSQRMLFFLQGTILDRIDYNVEQTQIQVGQGYQQLQKADAYQRKNRKMVCILGLAAAIILLLFLLIIFKT